MKNIIIKINDNLYKYDNYFITYEIFTENFAIRTTNYSDRIRLLPYIKWYIKDNINSTSKYIISICYDFSCNKYLCIYNDFIEENKYSKYLEIINYFFEWLKINNTEFYEYYGQINEKILLSKLIEELKLDYIL
jgi:hypothetical protein